MSELTAYHLPGRWGLVSVSPFCLKLDAFLRMTGIPHRSVTAATPFAGPKKKAPWIEHEGRKIGDSTLIILYLKERFGVDADAVSLGRCESGVCDGAADIAIQAAGAQQPQQSLVER